MWAVLLGLLMVLAAATSSHASTLSLHAAGTEIAHATTSGAHVLAAHLRLLH